MVAWTLDSPRGLRAVLIAAMLGAGVAACAAPPTVQESAAGEESATQASAGVLSDVWVERDGDASVITLVGLDEPVYSAFLHEDPKVLVLDIAAEETSAPTGPQAIYDGLVEQVSVSTFDGGSDGSMTRVEVTLADDVQYDVEPSEAGLTVRLSPVEPAVAETQPTDAGDEADPWANPDLGNVVAGDDSTVLEEPADMTPPPPATTLSSVDFTPADNGVLLHLVADGVIASTQSFTLDNPARLVVDLPGLVSGVGKSTIAVNQPTVSRVRVGSHADKVRVVVDGGSETKTFQGRRLVPASDGLFVTVGSGADLDEALSVAMSRSNRPMSATPPESEVATTSGDDEAPAADTTAETAASDAADTSGSDLDASALPQPVVLATVHGIHFDSQPDRDRIVVLSEGMVQYDALYPDPESMVLSIASAKIPRDAEGRITPTPGGPVSLISAFQQPDVEVPEVRIVVKRAPDLEPEISRKGEILFIDFPHTNVAAAAPPAFPGPVQTRADGAPIPVAGVTPVAADTASLTAPAGEAGSTGELQMAGTSPSATPGDAAGTEISGLPEFSQPAAIDPAGGFQGPGLETTFEPVGAPAALEPPAAVDMLEEGGLIDGKEYQGRRISLDFKDVEIGDVLRIIAEVSDLNIVAGEEVSGKVTIRLVDVPWDQALDVILLTKGLGFVRVGSVLRIAPADILAQEEEVRLQERRNKEKLEDLVVKLHPVNYAAVADVKDMVQRLLSSRGTVNIDKRTNTVILKDIASVIDEASALINAIDTQTPQVMIEAKIVEAALDFSRELGTVWSIGTQPLQDGFTPSSDPRRDLGVEDFLFHDQNSVIFSNPITSLATGLASLNAFILDEKIDLGVSLAAAESSGDGKVISSPRVVTLDNREAEIEQGVSIPFQTFENGDAKLEFIDAVLRLKVTPHITADKSIIMALEVERNAPDDTVQTPTGSPAIAKNEARTETLVKDGQTLVIGGIYTIVKSTRESRVPYLSQIPILGAAFKSKEVTDQRKELLIFVTPRVVLQPAA